jgi:hypothetical protein
VSARKDLSGNWSKLASVLGGRLGARERFCRSLRAEKNNDVADYTDVSSKAFRSLLSLAQLMAFADVVYVEHWTRRKITPSA